MIRTGDLVEFTDRAYRSYPPADESVIRYGVAVQDETPESDVRVMIADGSIVAARYIHAYAWAGWMPEALEPIYAKLNHTAPFDPFEEGY